MKAIKKASSRAGRPKIGAGQRKIYLTLDHETIERLRIMGDGGVSKGVRRAAKYAFEVVVKHFKIELPP